MRTLHPVAGASRRGPLISRPLAAAVSALAEGPRAPLADLADPAAVLAGLMDLHGSVSLARELSLLDRHAAPPPASEGARAEVRALAADRLGELAEALDHVFAAPFHRRNKLPDAAAVHATLEQTGVLPARDRAGRPLASAAGQIWEPFGELMGRLLGRIRLETRALREELAPSLRALGPEAARLERLDAAISAATQKRRERALAELVPGLSRAFARAFRAAVGALPEGAGLEDVAGWFGQEQWLLRELQRMELVVQAVLAHEAGRLLSLVDGAAAAGAPA
ncbi:hypothetical protein predicted by Glimmer/Critica [Sorangium cellulosum So ce56]|uniref:DUF3348 domain-containing protein n=1 Tax=Sorangium cellulosum (strain So ce56) TaxID=448385 RepID=A9FZK2_SORC5|nr:hypothetical protein predicted by Glimmer/Critica [Sorangium cellulosum So ce56]